MIDSDIQILTHSNKQIAKCNKRYRNVCFGNHAMFWKFTVSFEPSFVVIWTMEGLQTAQKFGGLGFLGLEVLEVE